MDFIRIRYNDIFLYLFFGDKFIHIFRINSPLNHAAKKEENVIQKKISILFAQNINMKRKKNERKSFNFLRRGMLN